MYREAWFVVKLFGGVEGEETRCQELLFSSEASEQAIIGDAGSAMASEAS